MPRDVSNARKSSDPLDEFTKGENTPRVSPDAPSVTGGWSSKKTAPTPKDTSGERTPMFKVPNKKEIPIKFVEEAPFASGFQHWISVGPEKNTPYLCIIDSCPLCSRGHKPKAFNMFNVIDLSETDDNDNVVPTLKVWIASPDPSAAIEKASESSRTSPLNRPGLYFVTYKTLGANNIPSYSLDKVTEEELKGDLGIEPLTEEQIGVFSSKVYGPEVVMGRKSKAELAEIAKKFLDS